MYYTIGLVDDFLDGIKIPSVLKQENPFQIENIEKPAEKETPAERK